MTTVYGEMKLGPNKKTDGDIGLEIEVEGKRLPFEIHKWWRTDHDGSLRGEENIEYVLAKPLALGDVRKALDYLDELYKGNKTIVDDSVRAGVHVHINCQKLTILQLVNFMVLYMTLENVLVHFCGEHREANLFCLRCSDAEFLQEQIVENIRNRTFRRFHHDQLRYSSMNLKALGDYGSLEFRAMRGTRDLDLIYNWVETLYNLREMAKEYANPIEIIAAFSQAGPEAFLRNHLGDHLQLITKGVTKKDLMVMLYDGMRNAQDIAFCIQEWDKWDQPKKKVIGGLEFNEDDDADEPEEDF